MTIHKKGQAHWEGDIKRGKGTVSTSRMDLTRVLKAKKEPTLKN